MADVRALLAAERESRRLKHPHLTYSKSGALTCNVCNLNIKSEQLWPGHQRSAGHRKSVQRTTEQPIRPAKRKIENVDGEEEELRKKHKSFGDAVQQPEHQVNNPIPHTVEFQLLNGNSERRNVQQLAQPEVPQFTSTTPADNTVDEDEWAAFERDVAPLTQSNYASATIEAAPVSATEIAEQQKVNHLQLREDEAQAEKEEESRRMEEEFEVMEEMEDRVKRLRARREALRISPSIVQQSAIGLINTESAEVQETGMAATALADSLNDGSVQEEEEDDDDEDWYS